MTERPEPPNKHPLLFLLDAAVRRDPAPSGFSGTLAVGVLRAEGVTWWEVECGPRPDPKFVSEPSGSGTWLLLGEREADVILSGAGLGAQSELPKLAGDASLFERFTHRYLRRQSAVALRAGASEGAPS